MNYNEMSTQQRAEHLLSLGVKAKLDIDPELIEPAWSAYVDFDGQELKLSPAGYHMCEMDAVNAATAWLRTKAMTPTPS